MPFVSAIAATFASSAALTWLVRGVGRRFGFLVHPRPDRAHTTPTAQYGGVAIFLALIIGHAIFTPLTAGVLGLLGLTTMLFLLGAADDTWDLRPQSKVVVQIAAGFLLYFADFHFNAGFPWLLDLAIVVFWVVAITNAMNLLDNMNGLCAGTAIIAAGFRCLFYYQDGNTTGAMQTAIFLGAVLGFLVFNFPRASIFMGDTGSMVVGFFLAALNLTSGESYSKGLISVLFFPVLVLALPIFDTTFVSVQRLLSGRAVSEGGRDHTSHRLVAVGLSEPAAVVTFYGISLASGATAFALYRFGVSSTWSLVVLLVLGLLLFSVFLANVRIYPEEQLEGDSRRFRLADDFKYKRVVLWVVVDTLTILLAWYSAFFLRFSGTPLWPAQQEVFTQSAPIAVACVLLGLFARGLYRTDWQHFSVHEIRDIVGGAVLGLAACLGILLLSRMATTWPFGLVAVALGGTVLMLAGSRLFVRGLADALLQRPVASERVLVYGAGQGGALAIRELRNNQALGKTPVGFVDDDPARTGMTIHGVSVLGTLDDVPALVRARRVDGILVSTRKLSADRGARLCSLAEELQLRVYHLQIGVVAGTSEPAGSGMAGDSTSVAEDDVAERSGHSVVNHHGRHHPLPGSVS